MIMSRIKHREGSGSLVRFVVLFFASLLILNAVGLIQIVDLIPQEVSAQTQMREVFLSKTVTC